MKSLYKQGNTSSFGNQKMYCLFCYKLVQQPGNNDTHRSGGVVQKLDTDKSPSEDADKKKEAFCKFFNLICSDAGSQNKDASVSGCSYSGVCDNCFYAVNMYCKLSQEMKDLQEQLYWYLRQLHKIMKTASKLPSRVKRFQESFEHEDINSEGDVVVTIRKGQMEKAVECRQHLFSGCARNSNLNCVNEQYGKASPHNSIKAETTAPTIQEDSNLKNIAIDVAEETEIMKNPVLQIADPSLINPPFSNSGSAAKTNPVDENVVERPPYRQTPVSVRFGRNAKRRQLLKSFVRLYDINEGQSRASTSTVTVLRQEAMKMSNNEDMLCIDEVDSGESYDSDTNSSQSTDNSHMKEQNHYPCQFCDFRVNKAEELVDHEIAHHRNTTAHHRNTTAHQRKPKCPRCPRPLGTRKNFQTLHYFRWHLGIRVLGRETCVICEQIFTGWNKAEAKRLLMKHVTENHSQSKRYRGAVCEVETVSRDTLDQHTKQNHPKKIDLIEALNHSQTMPYKLTRNYRKRKSRNVTFNKVDEVIFIK